MRIALLLLATTGEHGRVAARAVWTPPPAVIPGGGEARASQCGAGSVSAHAHGAVGNGIVDDTKAIQATIEAAAALAATAAATAAGSRSERACAVLELGIFVSGTVLLRSGVTLYLEGTAILKASLDHTAFVPDHDWPGQAALVVGASVTNAAVAGRGVIDGSAPMFVTSLDSVADQFKFGTDNHAYPGIDRVRLVDFRHSSHVSVVGVTLQDGTGFHLHFLNCSEVLAEGVRVHADLRWPNNDGIDVTSCTRMLNTRGVSSFNG